jgi:hypothetical protein
VANLRAQVHFEPDNYVAGVAAEDLRVERIPALLQVGQEDGVIDVALGVRITPPDPDKVLKHRGHMLAPNREDQPGVGSLSRTVASASTVAMSTATSTPAVEAN